MRKPNEIEIGNTYMYPMYINSKSNPFMPCLVVGDHPTDERRYEIVWLLSGNKGIAFKNPEYFRIMPKNWAMNEIEKNQREISYLKGRIDRLFRLA